MSQKLESTVLMKNFRKLVLSYYRKHGRHKLPWRRTTNPHKILVSEIMLQQTQVSRVIPKYKEFLKQFPTVAVLAKSDFASVLRAWSGLGYNRRAKYLREAAQIIQNKGAFPSTYKDLLALPGVGNYTAKAIRVFAFNKREILIETNIRTAFLHHFLVLHISCGRNTDGTVGDAEILKVAAVTARWQNPRKWHWALMDYGAHLKKSGVKLNHKSAQYRKQSRFEGSIREVRGAILRSLGLSSTNEESLAAALEFPEEKFKKALQSLYKDGLIEHKKDIVRLALR